MVLVKSYTTMRKDKVIFVKTDAEFRRSVAELSKALGKTTSQFVREAINEKIEHELSLQRFDAVHNVAEFLQQRRVT